MSIGIRLKANRKKKIFKHKKTLDYWSKKKHFYSSESKLMLLVVIEAHLRVCRLTLEHQKFFLGVIKAHLTAI